MDKLEFCGLLDYLGCSYLNSYGHCIHSDNSNSIFDNCCFDSCPLKTMWLDAKKGLDEYDPFFREEDYE